MKISFSLLWYDLWIGVYIDRPKRRVYICPLPCCVIMLNFEGVRWCKLLGHTYKLNQSYDGYGICDRCGAHDYFDQHEMDFAWFWWPIRLWWTLLDGWRLVRQMASDLVWRLGHRPKHKIETGIDDDDIPF